MKHIDIVQFVVTRLPNNLFRVTLHSNETVEQSYETGVPETYLDKLVNDCLFDLNPITHYHFAEPPELTTVRVEL